MENPVEKNVEEAVTPGEADLLDEFQKVLTENEKLRVSEANWKKVGLAKKRGEPVPEEFQNLTEEEIDKRAEEKAERLVAEKQLQESEQKQRDIALKALKENRELKIALRNRSGIATTPTGTGAPDLAKSKDTFWTAEQLAYFKKKGLDPNKVKENYLKLKA